MSSRGNSGGNVWSGKCRVREVSVGNCPVGEVPVGEVSVGEMSSRRTVLESCCTYYFIKFCSWTQKYKTLYWYAFYVLDICLLLNFPGTCIKLYSNVYFLCFLLYHNSLTHFSPLLRFYTPWKRQKNPLLQPLFNKDETTLISSMFCLSY